MNYYDLDKNNYKRVSPDVKTLSIARQGYYKVGASLSLPKDHATASYYPRTAAINFSVPDKSL